jgi:aspartyl-tRNA(Asn)/glutamyl-tRNA(Gln) amidotransferase subunit A
MLRFSLAASVGLAAGLNSNARRWIADNGDAYNHAPAHPQGVFVTSQPVRTLAGLATELAELRVSSRALVTDCLERIAAKNGEGARAFLKVYGEQALASADFCDQMRKQGARLAPHAGIPVSIKDLFDVAGDTTLAGSTVLKSAAPATRDATSVARLKAAGFIVIGRTNMTEFAFSGLGINPHFGTPLNPWDRATRRIPGGSSSGAAVSISDAMSYGALGTDTGGSCRIPAAMCGVVGFKPTASRVPLAGTYPLSTSLDSIGPLANSVACCATLDAVLAGENPFGHPAEGHGVVVGDLRLAVLSSYVTDRLDPVVAESFDDAVRALGAAGARLTDVNLPELSELPQINSKGGISAAEAFAHHRGRLEKDAAQYDPRVLLRILRGHDQEAADYIDLLKRRASFIEQVSRRIRKFDAVLMPTIPITPPALSELVADEAYVRINGLALRNPSIVNFLDGCAISIPCHQPGAAPVGLTLFGLRNTDRHLLAVAAAVEACLR